MSNVKSASVRNVARTWLPRVVWWVALLGACSPEPPPPSFGSNSNWLKLCDEDADCGGDVACRCGACANECTSDADCGELDDARCAVSTDTLTASACFEAAVAGICLPRCEPGSCDEQMPCVAGGCIPLALPSNDFCAPEATADADERILEDNLLLELAALRAEGGVTCGDDVQRPPAPPLAVDARLWCTARVLARDLEQAGGGTLFDSLGRNTQDRLQLAGYDETLWGEALGVAETAALALQAMLSSPDACHALTSPDLVDVGVGVSGDVAVITLARP